MNRSQGFFSSIFGLFLYNVNMYMASFPAALLPVYLRSAVSGGAKIQVKRDRKTCAITGIFSIRTSENCQAT